MMKRKDRPRPIRKRADILAGAIEAGGTKFVCAIGTGPDNFERAEFATGERPESVLEEVADWLEAHAGSSGAPLAIGIGSFGPIDLDPDSTEYGQITSTPKPGWRNTDMVGAFRRLFPTVPIAFDTDVNAAALGEYYWGHAADLEDVVYITIGTGIGAGGLVNGSLIHGLVHPEMGHMLLPRIAGDTFEGICPFHIDCWEGLCSGPALRQRTGMAAEEIPPSHEAWSLETQYIAYALANIVCTLSPRRIIIGGSVRKAGRLGEDRFFEFIRDKLRLALNEYVVSPALGDEIDNYVVPPLLGDDAGVLGALALGQELGT
jgi:fructokinase